MDLIERDDVLETLNELLREAADGSGRVALIRGEAGIGKTSVVKEFVSRLVDVHLLWGGCDDMLVPRPLGPLWDMTFDEPTIATALESERTQNAQPVLSAQIGERPHEGPKGEILQSSAPASQAGHGLSGIVALGGCCL